MDTHGFGSGGGFGNGDGFGDGFDGRERRKPVARCHSACAAGLAGMATEVEVHVRDANPRFDVVGLPDAAGREARDRVRSALTSSGYRFPRGQLLVNLAPADVKKVGPAHDLPMALGILAADGVLPRRRLRRRLLVGELALDGRLRPVRSAFLLASTARARGLTECIVPAENAAEAALAAGVPVYGAETLVAAVRHVTGADLLEPCTPAARTDTRRGDRDFADVRGQIAAKEALTVAAAGGHNVLLVGPPGAGKTLLATRFVDLLPPLSTAEALEVARIRSAAGLPVPTLPYGRPFRAPSCSASRAGVLGGGNPPGPGEVSLAHRGVLFLDEAPHFHGDVLEGLRQPLEDGVITISRARNCVSLPANVQLILAMNPCPCGHGTGAQCKCTPLLKERYRRRLSGPLLDRIDLRVYVRAVKYAELREKKPGADTATMSAKVARARAVQRERFCGERLNAAITARELDVHCRIDASASACIAQACEDGKLTARGVARVLRVARTIADLHGEAEVTEGAVTSALGWRLPPEA